MVRLRAAMLVSAQDGEGNAAASLSVPSDPAEMFSFFFDRGWTDGLPVLPPTLAAVRKMVAAGGKKADAVLGVIPPLNGVATVEKIAANAVMAGCLPDYFPLVLAAVRGMTRPGYNLDGLQTTTGNIAPLAIVNGPCRNTVGDQLRRQCARPGLARQCDHRPSDSFRHDQYRRR